MSSRFLLNAFIAALAGLSGSFAYAQNAQPQQAPPSPVPTPITVLPQQQRPPQAITVESAYPGAIATSPSAGFSGTIQGAALSGGGAYLSGAGQYNYNTALADRQEAQAASQWIDDHAKAVETYFQLRSLNNLQWLADNPRLTPEQIAKMDRMRLPDRLSISDLDPVWGVIHWPYVLQRQEFDAYRNRLDDIFAHRNEERFGVGTPVFHQITDQISKMDETLNAEQKNLTDSEWIHAHNFLQSLAYEARFPAETTGKTATQVSLNK